MTWNRLFGRRPKDAEIDDELQAHLRMAIQDRVDRGESPRQARRAALRELGNPGLVKEDTRAVWVWVALERLAQDLRYALRQIRNSPGFTAVAVLTLAVGLSVNVTIFSMISAIFLRPLPVKDAERLVVVLRAFPKSEFYGGMSWSDFQDYRAEVPELSDMLALAFRPAHLSVDGRTADRTWIEAVSGNYFSILGVTPLVGRFFVPGEGEKPGADPIAVLGHHYWNTRLGGDPGIVGTTAVINGRAFNIIGIAPPDFTSAQWSIAPSAFVPATMMPDIFPGNESILERRDSGAFKIMAHLAPGVNEAEATTAVRHFGGQLAREYRPDDDSRTFVRAEQLTRPEPHMSKFIPFAAVVFSAMAGLVLLIACANVANLMFSRAVARHREIGIRTAIGAPRGRLIRQLLTESMVLAMLAGAMGMLLSFPAGLLLADLTTSAGEIPIRPDEGWDWLPLLYTFVISLAAGAVMGLVPALRATRVDLYSVLKGGGSGVGRRRHLFRSGLVLAQIAVSVVVLVSGGLFVHSLLELTRHDLGFRTDGIVMASVDLELQGYDQDRGRRFFDQLIEQVEALPGVESAAIGSSVPLDMQFATRGVVPADSPAEPDAEKSEDALQTGFNRVDPGYFDTLGVTLLRGREFTEHDGDASPRVAVVNQTFADRLWPGQEAIGQRFRWQSGTTPIEVIGVAGNGKYLYLGEAPRAYAYVPIAQQYGAPVTLHALTLTGDPLDLAPALRNAVRDLDPDLPVYNIRTMEEHLRTGFFAFQPLRMGAIMAGAQGLVALLLAVMGVYGVVAYAVSRQKRDIGIRMALGAQNLDVFRLVSRSGLRPALIGLVLGLAVSLGLARLLTALLYGLDPVNIPVFATVFALVLGVSLLACWLPARRATRVNPIEVLRHE